MLSVNSAASIGYYMGDKANELTAVLKETERHASSKADVPYYGELKTDDPLVREATWHGQLLSEVGLTEGQSVDAKAFSSLYFGHHAVTGKPLHDAMPDIASQIRMEELKAQKEKDIEAAIITMEVKRNEALTNGVQPNLYEPYQVAQGHLEQLREERRSLAQAEGSRDFAHDLVFTAPKSISMYVVALHESAQKGDIQAGVRAKQIEQAFMEANLATMQAIEKEVNLHRPRVEGVRHFEPMKQLAWASFMHFDSRPVNGQGPMPNLHAHNVIPNIGKAHDGSWAALYSKAVTDKVKVYGAMHRAEFADRLRQMGIDVIPEVQDNILSFSLAGVNAEMADKFSDRAKQIEKNLAEGKSEREAKTLGKASKTDQSLLESYAERNASLAVPLTLEQYQKTHADRFKELYAQHQQGQTLKYNEEMRAFIKRDKRYKSLIDKTKWVGDVPQPPKLVPPHVAKNDQQRQKWDEKINELVKHQLDEEQKRIPKTPDEILAKLMAMKTHFTWTELEAMVQEASIFRDDTTISREAWVDAMKESLMSHEDIKQVVSRDGISFKKDEFHFTTKKQVEREIHLYNELIPQLMENRAQEVQAALSRDEAEKAITDWETFQPPFDKEGKDRPPRLLEKSQRANALDLLTNPTGFQISQGFAGSGKTFGAKCAFEILQTLTVEGIPVEVIGMAPQNTAANQLKADTGVDRTFTPEKFLLEFDKLNVGKHTVLYMDEASMVDFNEMEPIFEKLVQTGAKIILSGDKKQLEAVGSGNVYKRLYRLASQRMEELKSQGKTSPAYISWFNKYFADFDTIQRQSTSIARQAVAMAETGDAVRAMDVLDREGFFKRHTSESRMIQSMVHKHMDGAEVSKLGVILEGMEQAQAEKRELSKDELRSYYDAIGTSRSFLKERVMLAYTNATVFELNQSVRSELKRLGYLGKQDIEFHTNDGKKRQTIALALGERINFTQKAKNNKVAFRDEDNTVSEDAKEVIKGQTGTVVGIRQRNHQNYICVLLDPDPVTKKTKKVWINEATFNGVAYDYAMTVHKAQGRTVDVCQMYATGMMTAELALVGISRARKETQVHTLYHHEQAFLNSIKLESRKFDATELSAQDMGLYEAPEVEEYIRLRQESIQRHNESMAEAKSQAAAERVLREEKLQARADEAKLKESVLSVKNGNRHLIFKALSGLIRIQKPAQALPGSVRPAEERSRIEHAFKTQNYPHEGLLERGIAARSDIPSSWLGKAEPESVKRMATAIEEIIYERITERTEPQLPSGNGTGTNPYRESIEKAGKIFAEGQASNSSGRHDAHPTGDVLRQRQIIAQRVRELSDVSESTMGNQGQNTSSHLYEHVRDKLAQWFHPKQTRDNDSLRMADDRSSESHSSRKHPSIGSDPARREWEWLAISGSDVIARNNATQQLEAWSLVSLEEAGRQDLIRAAQERMGVLIDPPPEVEKHFIEGEIIAIGESHFRKRTDFAVLPSITYRNAEGQEETVWGAQIPAAIQQYGIRVGDWVHGDTAMETVSKPILAAHAGEETQGLEKAVITSPFKDGKVWIRTAGGEKYYLTGNDAHALKSSKAGDEVEIVMKDTQRNVWSFAHAVPPNPINKDQRQKVWNKIKVFADRLGEETWKGFGFGSMEKSNPYRTWKRQSDDVVLWNHRENGIEAWQGLGWANDDESRRIVGKVFHSDDQHHYLVCGVGGRSDEGQGKLETIGQRIVAIPKEALPGVAGIQWTSFTASAQGIQALQEDVALLEVEMGDVRAVEARLKTDITVQKSDAKQRSMLHKAAAGGHKKLMEMMLDHGADIQAVDQQGQSALHTASRYGHAECIDLLLKRGSQAHINKHGLTPVQVAERYRQSNAVKQLKQNSAVSPARSTVKNHETKGRK